MKPTTKDQLLHLLRSKPWVPHRDLAAVTPRYGARFDELREAGYVIDMRRVAHGFEYHLASEPAGVYQTRTCPTCGWTGISWAVVPERTCAYGHPIEGQVALV